MLVENKIGGLGRVLVTGAEGFVGTRLIDAIKRRSAKDTIVFSTSRENSRAATGTRLQMNLMDCDSVMRAVQEAQPDTIIHLAGQSSVGAGIGGTGAASTWEINAVGALALAKAVAAEAPEANLLFASTAEVYGQAFNDGVADETTTPRPQSSYARSKLSAEMIFGDVLPSSNTLIVARPTNHSGRGQDRRFVLPAFAAQMGQPRVLVGNLDAQRDFLHVDDVVDAYLDLISVASALPSRNLFNIASGKVTSIKELLQRMIDLCEIRPDVVTDPDRLRPSDIPTAAVRADRLSRVTGWKPRRGLDMLIRDVMGIATPR